MFPLPINGGSVACALLVLMMKAILLVPLDSLPDMPRLPESDGGLDSRLL